MLAAPPDRRRRDHGGDETKTEKQEVHAPSPGLHPRPMRLNVRLARNSPMPTGTAPRMTKRKAAIICTPNQRRARLEVPGRVARSPPAFEGRHGSLHPVMRTRARGLSAEAKTSVARFSPCPGM